MAGLVAAARLRRLGQPGWLGAESRPPGGPPPRARGGAWGRPAPRAGRPARPGRLEEGDLVGGAQLYGRFAGVVDDEGLPVFAGEPSWSENDLVQAIARQPGGTAWYVVDAAALAERVRGRTVEEMIGVAE